MAEPGWRTACVARLSWLSGYEKPPVMARMRPVLFSRTTTVPCTSGDRKSTRLNSSHVRISYAVFCLKKKIHDYQVARIGDTPVMETYLMPSTAEPKGVGEPGLPCLAPAVTNALFALTGKRVR